MTRRTISLVLSIVCVPPDKRFVPTKRDAEMLIESALPLAYAPAAHLKMGIILVVTRLARQVSSPGARFRLMSMTKERPARAS